MEAVQGEGGHPGDICPGCGQRFQCGMEAGLETCWCAALPPLPPVAGVAGCYCPECLAQRVRDEAGSAAGR